MTVSWFDNNNLKSDSIAHSVDDNFKVITNVKGNQEEDKIVVDVSKLKNATSQPKISIAGIHYEIFGTGNVKLLLGEKEMISINGRGNYGLKPTEIKLVNNSEENVKIKSDSNVPKFNISLECHKESGFEV